MEATNPKKLKATASSRICSLLGCAKQVFVDPATMLEFDFCGRTHAIKANERKIVPSKNPTVEVAFAGDGWEIHLLQRKNEQYGTIKNMFIKQWGKPSRPSLLRIYEIKVPDVIGIRFGEYSAEHQNVSRLFHGTTMSQNCLMGIDQHAAPCSFCHYCVFFDKLRVIQSSCCIINKYQVSMSRNKRQWWMRQHWVEVISSFPWCCKRMIKHYWLPTPSHRGRDYVIWWKRQIYNPDYILYERPI